MMSAELKLDKWLAYIPQFKIAAILANDIFRWFSWIKIIELRLKFHLIFSQGPINNMPALVNVMAWHRTGDKPLPEPMMTQVTDAYCRH